MSAAESAQVEGSTAPRWRERLGAHLRPPDVWHTPPPSLAQQWQRAREAAHLPDSPVLRAANLVYLAVVGAGAVLAIYLHWATASPARGAVLAVAVAAVAVPVAVVFL